ncbi:unnamed protein product [Amoebophrya sp. A25]|nr:unnamed protein product [Amoebophrya sp. A25]|eukprot:GSA25T00021414001.1
MVLLTRRLWRHVRAQVKGRRKSFLGSAGNFQDTTRPVIAQANGSNAARSSVRDSRSVRVPSSELRPCQRVPSVIADPESDSYDRRSGQATVVLWFIRLAKQFAPEFEFYELPDGSRFPLLIRHRSDAGRTPFDGHWQPIQIRATANRARRIGAGEEHDNSFLVCAARRISPSWYFARNESYRSHPDVPCVVMSPFEETCFVFTGNAIRTWLRAKPGSENEIRLQESPQKLGDWLRATFPSETEAAGSGDLASLLVSLAASPNIRKHRLFLVQMLRLPVLQRIAFHRRGVDGLVAHNAKLHHRRLLIRRPETLRQSAGGNRRLRYIFSQLWSQPLQRGKSEVDYLLLLIGGKDDSSVLRGIGIIPLAAVFMRDGKLAVRSGNPESNAHLKQHAILHLDSRNNLGGDFRGFDDFFYFFTNTDQIVEQSSSHSEFPCFLQDVFEKWDSTMMRLP